MKEPSLTKINNFHGLNHVSAIQKYIEVICQADDMHALIVEGAPGWGKTTAVQHAVKLAGREEVHLGAYSTPLNLYNFLAENSSRVVLLDDCSGLFNDLSAMAILKAATWPSLNNKRIIKWGSTSNRVTTSEFEFRGKLLIVCNHFPSSPDGEAIRSRGYVRRIDINVDEAKSLLLNAAKDKKWFRKTELAVPVADFLVNILTKTTLSQMSFRTLKKGYRLAEVHPDSWQELFSATLPKEAVVPEELVRDLSKQNLKVKDQAQIFQEKTGLQLRTFYNYRKEAKIKRIKNI